MRELVRDKAKRICEGGKKTIFIRCSAAAVLQNVDETNGRVKRALAGEAKPHSASNDALSKNLLGSHNKKARSAVDSPFALKLWNQ